MNHDDESAALHHQQELEQQQQLEKPLGPAAIQCNIEYFRAQRIRAHGLYLKAKRSEHYWQSQLEQQSQG